MNHERLEKNINLMAVLIVVVISIGGLVEIVPLMASSSSGEPYEGVRPYPALELAGRDVYVREGCYGCHSQQIRPFRSETERYGPYSVAGEFVYDRPFQFGSKRTGPDLARVGGRYSDEWHRIHLVTPQELVPDSNMPAYPWLAERRCRQDARSEAAGRSLYGRADRRGRRSRGGRQRAGRAGRLPAEPRHRSRGALAMSMDIGLVRGLVTLALLLAFLGLWGWAWSRRRKKDFEEAERLPLDEEDEEHPR